MLDECRGEWQGGDALVVDGGGDEDLSIGASADDCFAVRKEVHDGVAHVGVRKGVSADVPAARVPLEKLKVGDNHAVAVSSCEYAVGVWHVDEAAAFDAVGVAHIEAYVVLDIEFP